MSPEQKLHDMRTCKTDHYDWTDEVTDEDLLWNANAMIKHSQMIESAAQSHGLPFIDTGTDFTAKLDKAFAILMQA